MNLNEKHEEHIWVVQRCLNAWKNGYENWPGYCENPVTRTEILELVKECENKWPDYEFRGHNVLADKK